MAFGRRPLGSGHLLEATPCPRRVRRTPHPAAAPLERPAARRGAARLWLVLDKRRRTPDRLRCGDGDSAWAEVVYGRLRILDTSALIVWECIIIPAT